MPVWLTPSRTATAVGLAFIVAASVVVLATGSSVAHLGPVLLGGVSLGTLVALLLPSRSAARQARTRG